MNIKCKLIASIAAFAMGAPGCAEAPNDASEVVQRVSASKATFASVPTTSPATNTASVELGEPMEGNNSPVPRKAVSYGVDGVTLERFVTTSRIQSREPTAAASSFSPDVERIYAFIDARNESSSDEILVVHFIGPRDRVTGGIELVIPASVPRWRTWAYTRHAKEPGLWRVEVRDGEGALVSALPFEVEPAP